MPQSQTKSLRSSPSVIRCAPGVSLRFDLYNQQIFCTPVRRDYFLYRNKYSHQDCLILQEDRISREEREADWQIQLNVAKCLAYQL